MADSAERFMREEVLPLVRRLEKQEPGLMRSLLQKAAALGLLGLDLPTRYGGLALPKTTTAFITERLGLEPSFSVSQGVHTSVACYPLLVFGTETQKAHYLPRLASGEWIGAYALTEPEAGSDALAGRTRAVLEPEGTHYRLSGTKMWITNAGFADLFVVFAKVDAQRFTAFLVERQLPGFQVEREEHKLGLKGSSTCRLTLQEVPVPLQNRLGEEGQGAYVALYTLNLGRFKIGASAVGLAKEAYRIAWEYAHERKQFGRPIIEFDLIRHKFANMYAQIYACESALYRLAGDLQSWFEPIRDEESDAQAKYTQAVSELAAECALLKVAATEMLHYVVDEALQVHGGYGFSEEFPIAKLYRDIRVNRIYEGTNEINRINLIELLMKWVQRGLLKVEAGGKGAEEGLFRQLRAIACEGLEVLASGAEETPPQWVVQPLADLLIALYLHESAYQRARQSGLAKHHAAVAILMEQTRRQLPGWLLDLGELLPEAMPVPPPTTALHTLYGAWWESQQ